MLADGAAGVPGAAEGGVADGADVGEAEVADGGDAVVHGIFVVPLGWGGLAVVGGGVVGDVDGNGAWRGGGGWCVLDSGRRAGTPCSPVDGSSGLSDTSSIPQLLFLGF